MADLQEKLQRFLTARFGVDVKDAFVSCIQKIHKENQDVAALEQPMKDATKKVLDIREEVVTASQNAVKTADDAKTIARAAESSSSEALATAKNAKDESFNASGDAQLAMSAAQNMQQSFSNMELLLSGKVDGAFVENGYLYLTSNNEVVAGPLGPFSGTGGSGGSSGNNAVLAVSNTSGWLSKSIAYGKECLIQITWSSLEDEMPTGNGVMKVTVNGIVKAMLDIPQGAVTADLGPYLSVGSNAVRIQISDAYENSRTINFNINAIEASMSSTFDSGTAFDGIITFTYVPVGAISKTVHILLDGKEIATVTTTSSGRQMSYTIPAQKHGAHTLEAYFDATVNGQNIESNHLYYEIICVESLNTTPIIATSFQDGTVAQYTTLAIPFTVYDPESLTAEVELSVNGNVVSRQTVDRTMQIWSYRADSAGDLALEISCGSASRTIAVTVTASEMEIEAETEGLSLYLSSAGRSNTEENPGVWEYGDISAEFSGFNFTSDGWQLDEDNIPVLRVSGDARLTIPVQPFAKDFRTRGKTIEIEFATRDVMNYDAVVLSCMSGNRGISVTPQLATLRSEQKEITTRYKENEHLRLSFVVEKKAANRLIYCYINGIMSGVVQYTRYIKSNPEWIFAGIYSDEGITGTSIKRRDGFNKMIEDALSGKIDLIVTKSVSRFARNTVDSLTTVRKLKEKGVEVYFEKENIFTLDSKGELLITIMSSLAQEESRSISENTTWGQRKRFADGVMSLAYSNFLGYKKGANPGDMEIVEEEAVIVRRIYDEYLAGKSPGQIAKDLTADGIPTPAKKSKWHTSTIISILQNEKYRGDAKLQKCFTTSFLDHKMQKNTGQLPIFYVSENHPAIIKPEVFEMVQEEFRRREAAGGRAQCVSIFSGRIVCGDCGGFYGRKKWHSNTKYTTWRWHCNNKFQKREQCQTPTLKEESLEDCFVAAFNSILTRKEELAANYAECLDAITDDSALKARMEVIQQETADLTTLINNLLMNSSKQRGSGEDTNARYEQYISRHEALQQEKLELAKKISLLAAKRLLVNAFLAELAKHDGPLTAFDPLVFQATVNYVTVNADCTVTFLFRDGTETTQIIEKGVRQYVRRQPKHNGDTSTDGDGGEST